MKINTNPLRKIQILKESLSNSEKRLAHYLCSEKEKIPFQTIYDVAKNAGVSTATVSRLTRRIGYKNFPELKMGFVKNTDTLQEIFNAIKPEDNDKSIVYKVFQGNIRSIEDTYNITDVHRLIEFAKVIARSKRVVCIGIGGSGNVARDITLRLSHLNLQAESYTDSYQILIQSLRSDSETVVLGISHSGRSSITVEGLKIAKSKNAITGGISNYIDSPLSRFSDFFFCTSFPETGVRVAALSSRIAQLCLVDAIYILVAKYKEKIWDIKKLNSLTDRILRNK